ncbi:hypothetical protein AURDEDRAFT_122239 [Auricularia subglabra TFB-10046 SS5]|nr:hypothetical protein AURDEDRAFT_122239 [Auricularia subglabra TFB-10046 SS5]
MSSKKNPLAVRPTNAFASHRPNHSNSTSAAKKQASTRQLPDDENDDPHAESRKTASKTSKNPRTHKERSDEEIAMLKEQFMRELDAKKRDKERLGEIGRIICRTLCPLHDLNDPLHWALKRRAGARLDKEYARQCIVIPRLALPYRQRSSAALGDKILAAFDDLHALIAKHGLLYVESQLTTARNGVRGVDTLKYRRGIMRWNDWGIPSEFSNDKSKRGWANEAMAKLLFPDHVQFSVEGAKMHLDGRLTASEKDIPCFVYADGTGDDMSGFLLGEYLLQGGAALLQGSQAPMTGRRASSNTAKKHHITSVNEVFILYAICQTRCALSNEESFSSDGSQGFNYLEFYEAMEQEIAVFKAAGENGAGEAAMEHVIETWNKYIFKSRKPTATMGEHDAQEVEEYRTGRRREWAEYAEQLLREREAREAEEDREQQVSPRQPTRGAEKGGTPLFLSDCDDEAQDRGNGSPVGSPCGSSRGSTSRRRRPGAASHVVRSSATPSPSSPKRSRESEPELPSSKRGRHRR